MCCSFHLAWPDGYNGLTWLISVDAEEEKERKRVEGNEVIGYMHGTKAAFFFFSFERCILAPTLSLNYDMFKDRS